MLTNNVIRAQQADHPAILALWQRSVKSTHHFLTATDIAKLYQGLKNEWLNGVELWLLHNDNQMVGFIGLADNKVEMLFVDDASQRKGYGKQLIDFAKQHLAKKQYQQIYLDVNEQNPSAIAFYQKQNFAIIGRSEVDGQGNPFPLIHMVYSQT